MWITESEWNIVPAPGDEDSDNEWQPNTEVLLHKINETNSLF
jgi:hypothetical protein